MSASERVVRTTCPYCGVGCNLELHIKDDFIFRVTSPFDSIVNKGNLCVKGRFGYDFIYNKDRITKPLIRTTPQLPGKRFQSFDMSDWREISWEEALDYTSDRLIEIYLKYGSDAIAAYSCAKATNEDNYLLQKLFRSIFRTNNIDHCTRLCHAGSVVALQMAVGSSAMSNTAAEVIHNDVFILTGTNTAETHPIIAIQMKAAIEKYGAKCIVVDPRNIEMVKWAELWLPEKPGTDVPVFSAMSHVILKEKLYNQEFIDTRTEGYEEFAKSMDKFTPEYAETISGVDRQLIVKAARMYAGAKNAAIYWALGIPEHSHGTDNALSLINLGLLTGQIGRLGTGLNPLRGQNNVQGASDCGAMPWHYPGYQPVDNEDSAQKFEKGWNIEPGGLNRQRGLTTTEILGNAGPGGIRSLYIMGENPMISDPDLSHVEASLKHLDLLIVQDIFLTETARLADVVLPSACFAEKDGTFTNTERRVQRVRRAVPAPGQAKADWEIIAGISTKMGYPMNYTSAAEIMAEINAVTPSYAGITYERLEKEGIQWPCPNTDHPGTRFLHKDRFSRGRGLFHAIEYIPPAELPCDEYPIILSTGRVLYHYHTGTMTRLSQGSMERCPESLVEINPFDAEKLGIGDGQTVKVSSRRGTLQAKAKITTRSDVGTVFMNFHFHEAAVNLLTNPALDPIGKIPEYKVCAVRVEAA